MIEAGANLSISLAVFLASVASVRFLLNWLRQKAILDHPNDRSSHSVPTPRGGGLAVMAVVLAGWAMLGLRTGAPDGLWTAIAGAGLLVVLSWQDDRRSLGPLIRLLVQAAAVAVGLTALPPGPVFQGFLPVWLDPIAAALCWLWFVNLFNFMDGIDGIAGVEAACIAIGITLITPLAALHPDFQPLGLILTAAVLGFLVWNWHPAKIFMGDVGSIPLGFLLGWLLLSLAAHGLWAPALILPAYFLADATITLCRRLLRGEKIWQAHRSHFYQQAVQAGRTHAQVTSYVLAADFFLMGLAVLAVEHPLEALAASFAAVALLLAWMAGGKRAP
jgi:UDP-N-acetylmuramyl pentapeptide phosphotransferase/UDP-N-acetylglucosamine-1-phosphate transferase